MSGLRDPSELDSNLLAPCIRKYFRGNQDYEMATQIDIRGHEVDSKNISDE